MIVTTRRDALKSLGALAALGAFPGLALAQGAPGSKRLVFVFLRGGLDGLSAVPAYGDPDFVRRRGELAIAPPGEANGALKLDHTFGLHPLLGEMHGLYLAGELAVFQAVATPYRERSHFDAQNLLENGTTRPYGRDAGWLNVALAEVQARGTPGVALGASVPLVLRGSAPVTSWSPSLMPAPEPDLLDRLARLYRDDPLLAKPFAAAVETQSLMETGERGMRGDGRGTPVLALVQAAGRFLVQPDGPRVAAIDFGGWDTHANQAGDMGPLARNLRLFDRAVAQLKVSLAPVWKDTAVIVVTEFGRTVAVNGSRGTDHGTGSAAFAFGGAVRGGRVIAEWPGLADRDLHEGRDLRPTRDLRSVFKAALAAQLGVGEAALETRVFPESRAVRAVEGVFG
jgi:uncharacterized protein (DUF1501 family)